MLAPLDPAESQEPFLGQLKVFLVPVFGRLYRVDGLQYNPREEGEDTFTAGHRRNKLKMCEVDCSSESDTDFLFFFNSKQL